MRTRRWLVWSVAAVIAVAGFMSALLARSPEVSATPPLPPDDDIPSLTAAYDEVSNSVTLTWTLPAEFDPAISGFHISWSLRGQNDWSSNLTITNVNQTLMNIEPGDGLIAHRYYDFRIAPFNGAGEGNKTYSDTVLFGPHVYSITNCDELQDIDSDLTGDYILANDIDCSETNDWTHGFSPISGTTFLDNAFEGTFDGKGHTISNLYSDPSDDEVAGVFGTLAVGASVKNVTLEGCQIYGGQFTGGLVGLVYGWVTVSDVATDCLVVGTNAADLEVPIVGVGGLAGLVAGFDEDNIATITRSHTSGVVAATYTDGGSFNAGGGLVGMMLDGSTLTDSYSTAAVIGGNTGDLALGGLAGGSLLIGSGPRPIIKNTYSIGNITALDNNVAGGLIGFGSDGDIENNFSASHIAETGSVTGGGLMGVAGYDGADVTWTNNYVDITSAGVEKCVGSFFDPQNRCTQVNTEEAPDSTYFLGNNINEPMHSWDFDHIWQTEDGDYPTLNYRPAIPPEEDGSSSSSGGAKQPTTLSLLKSAGPTATRIISLNDYFDYLDGTGHTLFGLSVGQVIHFDVTIGDHIEHHTMTIKKIGSGYVIVSIASKPFDLRLTLNGLTQVVIDGQTVMSVQLLDIHGHTADLMLAKSLPPAKASAPHTTKPAAANPPTNVVLITAIAMLGAVCGIYIIKRRRATS